MKLDWKIYAIAIGLLLLAGLILFLEKLFFFLVLTLLTVLVSLILRYLQPLKYMGIELATLSTILVGVVYGPVIGGVYGFTILLIHLILGHYYMGSYLIWVIPEYILLGILSGIFKNELSAILGLFLIVGINVLNMFLTSIAESDRVARLLPYAIGNSIINSVIFIQFFDQIVAFIT